MRAVILLFIAVILEFRFRREIIPKLSFSVSLFVLVAALTLGVPLSFRLSFTMSQCLPFELYDMAYLVTQLSNMDWP